MLSRAKAIANDEPASPPPTTTTSKLDAARTAASLLQHLQALQRPELEYVEAAGIDPRARFQPGLPVVGNASTTVNRPIRRNRCLGGHDRRRAH
jgi:hypothetical protein